MGRAPCCDKANVKKGPWSPEEDAKLKAYIDEYGTGGNWIALPQKVGLKRCGKSCRLRWLNYLRPNIKHGGFTEEEDNIICSLYISIGSRWSIIAAQLPGRTDNDIKNYWNTRLKNKLLGRKRRGNAGRFSSKDPNKEGNNEDSQSPSSLSSSALERLQLHIQLQTLQDPFSLYNNPVVWPKMHAPLLREKLEQSLRLLDENRQSLNSPVQSLSGNSLPADLTSISLEDYTRSLVAEPSLVPEVRGGVDDGFGTSNMGAGATMANCDENEASLIDQRMGELNYYDNLGNGLKDNLAWWPSGDGADMKSESGSSWDSSTGNVFPTDPGMFQEFGAVGESIWHQSLLE
ncbi:hypothetical protein MLD38_006728 [Melastoma candidum]|uniref:Uncharacterized protein n=1 Tax=Melastoma candidum TaxID=119954 RepID=A0ACB9RN17_9MYRT|nr:hypothetical protein MLD38_006728 [Melastoma candidum]